MNVSDNGIEFLILKEGLKLNVYKDVVGLLTIGVGHLITKEEKASGTIYGISYKDGITKEQALEIKKNDLAKFEEGVTNLVKVDVTQNEFDALVSLSFNIGIGAFGKSTLLKFLNGGKSKLEVSDEFLKWNDDENQTNEDGTL